jgi:hypothetical protein
MTVGNSLKNTVRALTALCVSLGLVVACGDDSSTTTTTPGDLCPGQTECGDVCADLQNDPDNCGGCGTACGAGESCVAGSCAAGSCPSNTLDCGGVCVDTQLDPANCGACGTVCVQGEVCSQGACSSACGGGTTDCSGVCLNTDNDNANCGACAAPCTDGEVCNGVGLCALTCQSGLIECSSACVDPQTDNDFCGATGDCQSGDAGVVCAPGETCSAGTCATFASCQAIKTASLDRGDGVYTIDRGDGPISVYCDMTAGRTYVSFAVGDYNDTYAGYVNSPIANWQTVPFQQAFIWFYNTHDGLQNLEVGWTSGNCCVYLTSGQALRWGTSATSVRLFTTAGASQCESTVDLGRYHVGPQGAYGAPPLPANYFITNAPTQNTACSASNNPGFFVESFL